MENKLSIIVPVYNTSTYIDRCLKSILNQTYKNIEIIIIDDFSNDNSYEICRRYKEKDSRILLKQNSCNRGVSFTRNAALELVTGKYIVFIDSDDYISKNHIFDMVNLIEKTNTDICITKTNYLRINKIEKHQLNIAGKISLDKLTDDWSTFLNPAVCCWIHNKLFLTGIIKTHNISFKENLSLGEDKIFCLDYFKYCKNISVNNRYTYTYNRTNEYSITRTKLIEHSNSIQLIKNSLYNFMLVKNKLDNKELNNHIFDLILYGNSKIMESNKLNNLLKYKFIIRNLKENLNNEMLEYNKTKIRKIDKILLKYKIYILYFILLKRRNEHDKI